MTSKRPPRARAHEPHLEARRRRHGEVVGAVVEQHRLEAGERVAPQQPLRPEPRVALRHGQGGGGSATATAARGLRHRQALRQEALGRQNLRPPTPPSPPSSSVVGAIPSTSSTRFTYTLCGLFEAITLSIGSARSRVCSCVACSMPVGICDEGFVIVIVVDGGGGGAAAAAAGRRLGDSEASIDALIVVRHVGGRSDASGPFEADDRVAVLAVKRVALGRREAIPPLAVAVDAPGDETGAAPPVQAVRMEQAAVEVDH